MPSLENCHALVLNADYQPVSYFPLSLWRWQDTVRAVFMDRVNVVSEYERTVRSPRFEMRLPSVIALKRYIHPARRPAFTRFNVFLRDGFRCQYCASGHELTFDHLVPRSRGGRTTWENVVAACATCNLKKGDGGPNSAACTPVSSPICRRRWSCSGRGVPFRPTICMRVGAITFTGTPSLRPRV